MRTSRHDAAYRSNPLWIVAQVHRISGVLLALFLPIHFLVLGTAIRGEAALDSALAWTLNPMVKLAEAGLLFLLSVHLLGGLRVLLIENLPWQPQQKQMAFGALALATVAALAFLLGTA
jgi:fumarate reductase subunit D